MSPVRRLWARLPGNVAQWLIVAWVLGISIAVGWVIADRLAADERQQRAVVGFCAKLGGDARQRIPPTTGEATRNLIRTAAASYVIAGCDDLTGPLGEVDPQVYRPGPTPTSTAGR